MDVKLVINRGASRGQTFRLRSVDTIVGRSVGCKLRIPSESVSRRHCRLVFRDDYLIVEDLASANGTLVNDHPIVKPTIVRPSDRLTIGSVTFVVQYQLTPRAIEKILEEQQKEMELLPTFDANESSLPVALPDDDPPPTLKKQEKKTKRKPTKPEAEKVPESDGNPDASAILEGRRWQFPTGENIRDILSDLEKE